MRCQIRPVVTHLFLTCTKAEPGHQRSQVLQYNIGQLIYKATRCGNARPDPIFLPKKLMHPPHRHGPVVSVRFFDTQALELVIHILQAWGMQQPDDRHLSGIGGILDNVHAGFGIRDSSWIYPIATTCRFAWLLMRRFPHKPTHLMLHSGISQKLELHIISINRKPQARSLSDRACVIIDK